MVQLCALKRILFVVLNAEAKTNGSRTSRTAPNTLYRGNQYWILKPGTLEEPDHLVNRFATFKSEEEKPGGIWPPIL